jgi:hypothetical protein
MKIGIVGAGRDKFTTKSSTECINVIRNLLIEERKENPDLVVVSGHSPMGGVDIWSEQIAQELNLKTEIYPATSNQWDGVNGYKDRNLKIAKASDVVYVFVVDRYPPNYYGRKWINCYHCSTSNDTHVKSGGCWTANQAVKLGKKAYWKIISNSLD